MPARPRLWWAIWRGGARTDVVVIALLGAVVMSAGLGLRDPWPPDEPRFALVAREMLETDTWLIPHRNGEIYPDKPPLFMWLVAGSMLLTGSLRIGFLLPSLLAGVGTALLVYDLARRLWHRRIGLVAGLTATLTAQIVLQARTAQIDAVLTLWTTLALYGLLRHLLLGPAWRWWVVGWAAMGLGVITKGVGFLPVLVLIPYVAARRRGWPGLPRFRFGLWHTLAGPVAMLAVIAAWLVPLLVAVGDDPALAAYRDNILVKQTVHRYTAPWHHERWFGYYLLQVAPWAWMPVTLALPWLVPAWRNRLRRHEPRLLLLLGWIALVLLFFSASEGKRGVYLLPAAPALVLAAAPLLPGLLRRTGPRRAARGGTAVLASLIAAPAGMYLAGRSLGLSLQLGAYADEADMLALPLLAIGLTGLAIAVLARGRRAPPGLAAFLIVGWIGFGWWVLPRLNQVRSAAGVMDEVAVKLPPGDELGMVDWREQFVLHADRPVVTFGYNVRELEREAREAASWAVAAPGRWLLVPEHLLPLCTSGPTDNIGRRYRKDWHLVSGSQVTPDCLEGPGRASGDASRTTRKASRGSLSRPAAWPPR
jgi:4-amino-4-deoxy-L-arabinose transferase-like glycosyltransferase